MLRLHRTLIIAISTLNILITCSPTLHNLERVEISPFELKDTIASLICTSRPLKNSNKLLVIVVTKAEIDKFHETLSSENFVDQSWKIQGITFIVVATLLLLQVPGLLQASAVMRLQSSRLSAVLRKSVLFVVPIVPQFLRLWRNVILCQARSLSPWTLPVRTCLSKSSLRYTCSRNVICLLRTWFKSSLCVPALLYTSSFVTLSGYPALCLKYVAFIWLQLGMNRNSTLFLAL